MTHKELAFQKRKLLKNSHKAKTLALLFLHLGEIWPRTLYLPLSSQVCCVWCFPEHLCYVKVVKIEERIGVCCNVV